MEELGNNKQEFLEYVRQQQSQTTKEEFLAELKTCLLQTYSDLRLEDYKNYINEDLYKELVELLRDPEEIKLWDEISTAPVNSPEEIQNVQRSLISYLRKYEKNPNANVDKAREYANLLQTKLDKIREQEQIALLIAQEQKDWVSLKTNDYDALRKYKLKYPKSVHKVEIDDYMWECIKSDMTTQSLNQYITDWQTDGKHTIEAHHALTLISEWEQIKQMADDNMHENENSKLMAIAKYHKENPNVPFINDVKAELEKLRSEEIIRIKSNLSGIGREDVKRYIDEGVFEEKNFIEEGLATKDSLNSLMRINTKLLPDLNEFQSEGEVPRAQEGCTDVYLFGTPGTGKTCLLMGLIGGNGEGYNLNMRVNGGLYAAALQQFVDVGLAPGRTFGSFVTTIYGEITEKTESNQTLVHKINIVEMAGEAFAHKLANNKQVKIADMGKGAPELLCNDNRKVFFLVVDPTKDMIEFDYKEDVLDEDGNRVGVNIKHEYISQLNILNKFMGLFALPENKEIMKKVDAIHFVVTKADMLGPTGTRKEKARDLLLKNYKGPVGALKDYCEATKRINYSTDYRPKVYPFSLGKFYMGDVFKFDSHETLEIIDTLRHITIAEKRKTFLDKVRDVLA